MSKRNTLVFLSVLVALLPMLGFGCKGISTAEQQATAPVSLEFWTVFDDVDALKILADKYMADRPYITITIRQLTADELYPRLVEALAEDRGPDIISVHNKYIRQFQSKLLPMPASVNDTTVKVVKGNLGTQTVITPTTRNLITARQIEREYVQAVKGDAIVDGKIYGLPLSLDTMALFYNKDLLDRAGVAEAPKNWDEFVAAVKKATKYDKKTGRILQYGAALGTGNNIPGFDDILYILFRQSNANFVTKTGQAVFNGGGNGNDMSPTVQILNFYSDFANNTRDTYSWNEDADNALDKFVNGSLAFFFGYSYHYPVIKARAPQLNMEVVPMLQLAEDQKINTANYWLQCVTQKSKHANEAWAFIDYLARSNATKEYLDATGRPTALRAFIADQNAKPELAPFVSQVLTAENWYKGRDYPTAYKALSTMLHEWLQTPPEPDKVIEWRQNIINRAAARVNQTL